MPTKLFLKPFCARYTTKLTTNLKRYDSTIGYLQLRLIGQFPSYMKIKVLPQVKTQGCLFAVFKEKPAELVINSELASPLPASPSVMMSAKRCGPSSLLLNIKGLTPEIHYAC